MKRMLTYLGSVIGILIFLCCISSTAKAEESASYYDCMLLLYAGNSAGEIVGYSSAVQIQAGDGSGNFWAVASFQITDGATQYLAVNPMDTNDYCKASLIAGNVESCIAVFQLEQQISRRTAPSMSILDGLQIGSKVMAASIGVKDGELCLRFLPVVLERLEDYDGYSFMALGDADTALSDANLIAVGALMTADYKVIGFYTGGYWALPAGYLISGVSGIGELEAPSEESGQEEDEPDSGDKETEEASPHRVSSIESIQSAATIQAMLDKANSAREKNNILRLGLIAAALTAAVGLITFAVARSRHSSAAGQGYTAEFEVIPLAGTPGKSRIIPAQGLSFGRSPECSVSFSPDTGGVSGKHCSLLWQENRLVLSDLGSSFGTILGDGRRLAPGESVTVTDGDCFYLGSQKIGFQIKRK